MSAKPLSTFTADERAGVARLRRIGRTPAELAVIFGTTTQTIRKLCQLEVFL